MTEVAQEHEPSISRRRHAHARIWVFALAVGASAASLSTVSLAAHQRSASVAPLSAPSTVRFAGQSMLAHQSGRVASPGNVTRRRHAVAPPRSTTRSRATSHVAAAMVARTTNVTPKPVRARLAPATSAGRSGPTTTPTPTAQPPSPAATALLAHLNPNANIAPSPNYLQSGNCSEAVAGWSCDNPCVTSTLGWPTNATDPACTNYVLSAINAARRIEGVTPMTLPSNWYGLTTGEQLFVVADLERTARGLTPYLGINTTLSAVAQRAAVAASDPSAAPGFSIATDAQGYLAIDGTWASGFSVLAADYAWMYNDGWGGASNTSNVTCTSATSSGCWSHRDELLGFAPGFNPGVGLDAANAEVGVGFSVVNGSGSFVDLIEAPRATPPPMTFTWATNVVPYL